MPRPARPKRLSGRPGRSLGSLRHDLALEETSGGEPAGRIRSRPFFGLGAHRQHSAHRVPPDLLRRTAHDHRGDDQSVRRHRRRRRLVNRLFRLSHDDEVASFGACGVWPVAGVAHPRCPVLGRAACFVVCFKECNLKMDSWWGEVCCCRSRIHPVRSLSAKNDPKRENAPWPSSWTSCEAPTARLDSHGYQVDGHLRPRVEGAG